MENKERFWKFAPETIGAIFGMIIFAGLVCLFINEVKSDLTVIDTKVELEDGTIYRCVEASSHDNGMTYIRNPENSNLSRITIPTRRIKMITRIK